MKAINSITFKTIKDEIEAVCSKQKDLYVEKDFRIMPQNFVTNCKAKVNATLNAHSDIQYSEEQKKEIYEFIDECVNKYKDIYTEEVLTKQKNGQSNKEQEQKILNPDIDRDPTIRERRTFLANNSKLGVFSDYLGQNNSYSAADIVASINMDTPNGIVSSVLGKLQTISYSIYQDKAPVRVLGNINAKDWVFGPRTIAGSLIFAVFNKHWLVELQDEIEKKAGMKNPHFISDEIPPFDITISFANEYGFDSRMALYGIRLMKEGQVMSVGDIYIENTYEFVANDIEEMNTLNSVQTGKSRHHQALIKAQKGADRIILPQDDSSGSLLAELPYKPPEPIEIPDIPDLPDLDYDKEVK